MGVDDAQRGGCHGRGRPHVRADWRNKFVIGWKTTARACKTGPAKVFAGFTTKWWGLGLSLAQRIVSPPRPIGVAWSEPRKAPASELPFLPNVPRTRMSRASWASTPYVATRSGRAVAFGRSAKNCMALA